MNKNSLTILDSSVIPQRSAWADLTGLIASIGCAIHCAAMPLVIGYLPMLGLDWLATQGFHQAMAVACAGIAIAAFLPGWRKHKNFLPATLGLVGIALITSHAFGAENCCGPSSICAEDACLFCSDSSSGEDHASAFTANESSLATLASRFSPWVTPLGGFFLIIAHLVNHRLACRCCLGEQACGGGLA